MITQINRTFQSKLTQIRVHSKGVKSIDIISTTNGVDHVFIVDSSNKVSFKETTTTLNNNPFPDKLNNENFTSNKYLSSN